jgi:hypothetical protein
MTTAANTRHSLVRMRAIVHTMCVLTISGLSVMFAGGSTIADQWIPSINQIKVSPELPVLVLLRATLLVVGMWIVLCSLVAVVAHLARAPKVLA